MSRPRRSADTKRELLDTGAAMLLEQGYHGTGIQEVLDAVGVPKGSFYNYFASKEDFGAQVIRHAAEAFDAQIDGALKPGGNDALGALRRFFAAMLRRHERSGFAGGCLIGNLGGEVDDSEVCRTELANAMRGWRDRYRDGLALAQEQGTVRTDIAAEELADFLLDSWEGAVLRMKIERSVRPLTACMTRLFDEYLVSGTTT